MHFKRIFTGGLAQCSYVIGGQNACLVVDPPRDIQRCLDAADEFGLPVTGIIETHLHADFISGHMDLARATGATIYAAQSARCNFEHVALSEGKHVDHDTLRIELMETPGHTPESAVFLISDLTRTEDPVLVFSGDALLVGDVGRPDLFPDRQEELAQKLYQSLRKIEKLEDNLELYPAHGMGSLCGRSLSAKLSSTIGTEKKYNYAFSFHPEEKFMREILEGMPEAPDHFGRCSEINRQGPPLVSAMEEPVPLKAAEFQKLAREDHLVLDVRDSLSFTAAHIPGAYCIPVLSNFSTFAGWVLPPEKPLLLVGNTRGDIAEAVIMLRRVGLDLIKGYLEGGMEEWINLGMETERLKNMSIHDLKERLSEPDTFFVDTRMKSELAGVSIKGTIHGSTPDLRYLFGDRPAHQPFVLFCNTSNRSILGASILQRRGFTNITHVVGGTTAWENAGYPLIKGNSG